MMGPNVYAGRAAAGAALLDGCAPGWWGRIDRERLDMGECDDDVLGQIYGAYLEGIRKLGLGLGSDQLTALGFDIDPEVDLVERTAAYVELTEAWRAVIEQRAGSEAPRCQ